MNDDEGPTVNGRPILTARDIQKWIALSDDAATRIASGLNKRAFESFFYAESIASNPTAQRARRIHDALSVLVEELPPYLRDECRVLGKASPEIESLLAQASALMPGFVVKGLPTGRGRPRNRALDVSADLARVLKENYRAEHPNRILPKKQLNSVVTQATNWLGIPGNDETNKKRRTRRGQ
jgi:hypothetical protein